MVKLWAARINAGISTIEDVPERYLEAVKKELGISQ